jgi:hypothetical protein
MRFKIRILFLALIGAQASFAGDLHGVVVSVADGNTLTLRVDQKKIIVRLAEIYAPERRQAFGLRSRVSLAAICHSKSAQIRVVGHDRNGRAIGYVSCNGVNGNAEQVRRVLTWGARGFCKSSAPWAMDRRGPNISLGMAQKTNSFHNGVSSLDIAYRYFLKLPTTTPTISRGSGRRIGKALFSGLRAYFWPSRIKRFTV